MVVAPKGGVATGLEREMITEPDAWALSVGFGAVEAIGADVGGVKGQLRIGFEPRLGPGFTASLLGDSALGSTRSESGVQARAGFRWSWTVWRFWFGAGAEAGGGLLWQTDAAGQINGAVAGVVAPRLTVRFYVAGPLMLSLDGEAAVMMLTVDKNFTALLRPSAQLGATFTF